MVRVSHPEKWLADRLPVIGPLAYRIYGAWIRSYVRLYTWNINRNHAATINPYHLISISPSKIADAVTDPFWFQARSTIRSGDWDLRTIPLEETMTYRSLRAHFVDGLPWEETELFQRKCLELDEGTLYQERYGTSMEGINNRFRQLDTLYESISESYRTQRELRRYTARDPPRPHLPPELLEVAVNIGRDGEWLFDDGRHRLAIAQLLGIQKIPVRVLVRHASWQDVRNEVAEANSIDELGERATAVITHPDIKPFVPDEADDR